MAKTPKSIRQQQIALGAFGVLLLGIVAYLGFLSVSGPSEEAIREGEYYTEIQNPRRIRGDKIEVIEFFSYGCIHCYNFDEDLNKWVEEQGDRINFIRLPAVANDYWRHLGQHYYTMEQMDVVDQLHTSTFRVLHDGARPLRDIDELEAFYEQQGVDTTEFRETFNGAEVASKLERADQMARRLQVASVPTIIIQGKYLVRTTRAMGPALMLQVMSQLVDDEIAAQNKEQP